jgi:hypothetical protein
MTGERTPNVPQLRKYVEWVEEQAALPEIDRTWYQRYWQTSPDLHAADMIRCSVLSLRADYRHLIQVAAHCGTAYCLAGKIAVDHDERYAEDEYVDGVHAADKALEVLGLERDGSTGIYHEIFRGSNNAARIREIAEAEAGERL